MTKILHKIKYRFYLLIGSLILSLTLGEIIVRNFLPQQLVRGYIQYDSDLGSYPRPNFIYHDQYGANYFVKTNDYSFRMEENIDLSPDRLRVIAYGDSFTFGLGLNYEHSYFAKLKTAIETVNTKIQFINAGVGGYSTGHVKILLERHIKSLNPSAIIYFLNNNDLVDNMVINPDYRVSTYSFNDNGEALLKDEKPFAPWKRWALAKTPYGWLNQNSHLLVFAKTMFKEIFGIGAVNEVKRPTIKSSKKPVQAVNEKSLQPQFTVSFDQFNYLTANQSKIIAVTIAHLKRIVKLSKKVNLPLIVAWIPSPEEMLPTNKNVEINLFFRSARQRFKALEKQYERYRFIDTVWPIEMNENWKQRAITLRLSDGHFNINGNEWYATHIRPQIIKFLQDQLAIPIIRDN